MADTGSPNRSARKDSDTATIASEDGSEISCSEGPHSKNKEVYPLIKNVCKGLFSHRVQREVAFEDTLNAIQKSKNLASEEESAAHEIRTQLKHHSQLHDKIRRRKKITVERGLHLRVNKGNIEKKCLHERAVSKAYSADAKEICTLIPKVLFNLKDYRKEKEELKILNQTQKEAMIKAVETELQRRQEISERRDRIKNQRRNGMQKSIEDKNSRREDLRQKFDQFVSSNQIGQELSMLQEKLKKAQHGNVQTSAEIQVEKLKEERDILDLANATEAIQMAITDAEKETDCKNEMQRVEEEYKCATEENKKTEETMEKILEEYKKIGKTSVEVRMLLVEERIKAVNRKDFLDREIARLQTQAEQQHFTEAEELHERNRLQQKEEELSLELVKMNEKNMIAAEEVDIFESLVKFTDEEIDKKAHALQDLEDELNEKPCENLSQKIELKKTKKLKDDLERQLLLKRNRIKQIEKGIDYLEDSIKAMCTQNLKTLSNNFAEEGKKLAEIEELQKSTSELRDLIKALENDREQLNAELKNLFTEISDWQEELEKLKVAKVHFEQVLLSHVNETKAKRDEAEHVKSELEVAEREHKKLLESLEECERSARELSDKVSSALTSQRDALLTESQCTNDLETLLTAKKPILAQMEESEQEEKIRLEEKQTKFEEIVSKWKKQWDDLDAEKKKKTEKMKRADEELATLADRKEAFKKEHEQVLALFDSAADMLLHVKDKYNHAKKQKIKLLNMVDMVEKVAADTDDRYKTMIDAARADLENCNKKYAAMIINQSECLSNLKRQLAAFEATISKIKEKRLIEKENVDAGLPGGPKPILKSPDRNVTEEKPRKAVSFGDSPDNLEILQSDSSVELTRNKAQKRKLMPLQQSKTDDYGKSCKTPSRTPRRGRSSPESKI